MTKQELARRIVRDMGYDYQTVRNIIDGIAFEGWLHDPNQVPGQTITESEYRDLELDLSDGNQSFGAVVECLGITVVPDPEPTNAEKLDADMDDWYAKNKDTRPSLSDYLIERGWVKAPGADDEH